MALPEYVNLGTLKTALEGGAGLGARTAADLPDARLQAALDDAHAQVLGTLATRYTLPAVGAEPPVVRSLLVAIAGYVATLEWLQGKDLSDRDPVVLRYQRALALLKGVSDGVLSISELEQPAAAAAAVETYNSIPEMGLAAEVLGVSSYPRPSYPSSLPDGMYGDPVVWT